MDYTEASASIAGYGYQFERALYRIFHSTHQDTLFGIETTDDVEEVVPTASGTKSVQEQDKHTLSAKNPLQDSSRNLWNTLRNWLNKLEQSQRSHKEVQFILVTNGSVTAESLAHKLSAATTPKEVSEAISQLKSHALTMNGAVAEIAAEVIAFSDASLEYVISHFELIEKIDSSSITEAMYAALHLPDGLDEHKQIILDSLTGYLFVTCLGFWRRKEQFWTSAHPLYNRKQILFDKFLSEAWTPIKQEDTDYKKLMELNRALKLPFISQLKELGIMESTIEKELGHYWAGYSERSRLLRKGKILPEHFDDLEETLHARWDNLRETYANQEEVPFEAFSRAHHKAVYLRTTSPENFNIAIGRLKSNHRYLYLGTYHHQVNDDGTKYPVHWHPSKGENL